MNNNISKAVSLINKELIKLKDDNYYGSEESDKQDEIISQILINEGWNYEEDIEFQNYLEKATDEERYKYYLDKIIPKLIKMEKSITVAEFLELNNILPTEGSISEGLKILIGKEIQYGEKESIVSKITKAGFVVFENGDTYSIEDLIMIEALVINDEIDEKIEFEKEEDENIDNLNLDEEKPKLNYHVSWEPRTYGDKEDEIVDINFFTEDNGFDEDFIKKVNKMKLGDIEHDASFDVEVIAVDENYKIEKKEKEEIKKEDKKSSINQPEYSYYVVKDNKTILTGWEYKEDANDQYQELIEYGEKNINVMSRRDLSKLGIDPYDDSNWNTNIHDWDIIEEALNFGVTEGDYDQESSNIYLREYKSSNKYSHVIKARLIYFLRHSQRHLQQAFLNSQVDKANNFIEKCTKTEMELLRMLKAE